MFPSHDLRRFRRLPRHTCRGCGAHPARFHYRGVVRADRDHELCFRCFRSAVERLRALRLAEQAHLRAFGATAEQARLRAFGASAGQA